MHTNANYEGLSKVHRLSIGAIYKITCCNTSSCMWVTQICLNILCNVAVQCIIWNEIPRFLYFSLSPSYASWEWKLRWKQPYQSIVHNTGLHTRSPICLQVTNTEGWIESDRNKAVSPDPVSMIKHNIYPCFNCQAWRQETIVTCVMSSQGCSWIKWFWKAIKTSLKIDIIGTSFRLFQFIWDMLHNSPRFHFLLGLCLPEICSQA